MAIGRRRARLYQDNSAKLARFADRGLISVSFAFSIARVIGVGMDDVLAA